MDPANTLHFTTAARALAREVHRLRLRMPGFRSPPGVEGVDRTLRRRSDGGVTISVRLRGRPLAAVLADMIEGIIAANRLLGLSADGARASLWAAVSESDDSSERRKVA